MLSSQQEKIKILVLVLFGFLVYSNIGANSQSQNQKIISSRLTVVVHQIRAKTNIPILLPTNFGIEHSNSANALPTTFTLVDLSPSNYYVILGRRSESCLGGNSCRHGAFSGSVFDQKYKQFILNRFNSSINGSNKDRGGYFSPEQAQYVKLKRGITGIFLPYTCGANCSDAIIFWEDRGFMYEVGLKTGKLHKVIEMANSAIDNRVN